MPRPGFAFSAAERIVWVLTPHVVRETLPGGRLRVTPCHKKALLDGGRRPVNRRYSRMIHPGEVEWGPEQPEEKTEVDIVEEPPQPQRDPSPPRCRRIKRQAIEPAGINNTAICYIGSTNINNGR